VHRPIPLVPLDPIDISAEYAEMATQAKRAEREHAQTSVDHACRLLREAGYRPHGIVRDGDPGHQLIHVARELDVDLVIAGARGASLLKGLGIGSVADRLLKSLPASVLLVRDPT